MTQELINDIIQWDVKSWSKALRHWDQKVDWSKVENGLELGGREGGLSLFLALKGKKVLCSDLSEVKKTAEALHIKHDVTDLVDYQDIDATNIPYENHFDVIIFKSIIGGIGRNDNVEMQEQVFRQIHKALKPGGKLLFAENLVASAFHRKLRKRFVNWGDAWRYVSIPEMHRFLSVFSSYDLHTTGVLAAFGRSEGQRKFLSAIDQAGLNAVSPKEWKYIAYGIAEK